MKVLAKFTAIFLLFSVNITAYAEVNFDIVANLDNGPGNVTVTDNGRIIMSMHQFYQPKYTVVEYKDMVLAPFPNKELADMDSKAALKLDSVLGIRSANGIRLDAG